MLVWSVATALSTTYRYPRSVLCRSFRHTDVSIARVYSVGTLTNVMSSTMAAGTAGQTAAALVSRREQAPEVETGAVVTPMAVLTE